MKLTVHIDHNESFQNDLDKMFPLEFSVIAKKVEDVLVLSPAQITSIKKRTGLRFHMLMFMDNKRNLWHPVSGIKTACDHLSLGN